MKKSIHRYVPAGLFLRFLLERPRALSIGVMVALMPLGILALISWLMSSMDGKGPDFETLLAQGVPVMAEVVKTERVTHITFNNQNPVRITYRYEAGSSSVLDVVQTQADAGYRLKPGQRVTALTYDGDSILPDFPPLTFPLWAIALIDGVFFLMGLPFLLFALHGAITKWLLYRRGRLRDGEVDSLASALCIPFTATRMRVAFTCTTEAGRVLKGTSVVVAHAGWRGKRRGSPVRVLVAEFPSEVCCVVEEDLLSRCLETP